MVKMRVLRNWPRIFWQTLTTPNAYSNIFLNRTSQLLGPPLLGPNLENVLVCQAGLHLPLPFISVSDFSVSSVSVFVPNTYLFVSHKGNHNWCLIGLYGILFSFFLIFFLPHLLIL